MVEVECPGCRLRFEASIAKKGEGAREGKKITKLSNNHILVLGWLLRLGAVDVETGVTSRTLEHHINTSQKVREKNLFRSNGIGGRLAELAGAGLVKMQYSRVNLMDERTREWRFRKKPVWWMLPLGVRALHGGGLGA